MAGAGVKRFTVGEVLSDVEVNTYLMDQSVAVFANEETRDAAFGGAGEPILSEGRLCYLQNRKLIQFYNGVSWSDSGQFTVADNAISAAKLKSDVPGEEAVTTAKIRNDAVTADKLADSSSTDGDRAVTTNHIRNNAVTSGKLASGLTLAGTTTLSGTGKIQQLIEKGVGSEDPLSGEEIINIENGAVYYYSADSEANFQFKITSSGSTLNSIMANHETFTMVAFCTQGTSAKKLSAITVDALTSGVTVRWFGGAPYPAGNPSSIDVYTITVVKNGNNLFSVFASQSSFK
jgi:hypothetical protein